MNHFVNDLYKLIEFSKNDVLKALRDPLGPLFSSPSSSLYNKKKFRERKDKWYYHSDFSLRRWICWGICLFIKQILPSCREGVKPIITLSAEERKTSYILSQCHCSAEVITCITRYYTIIIPSLLGITPFYLRINPS